MNLNNADLPVELENSKEFEFNIETDSKNKISNQSIISNMTSSQKMMFNKLLGLINGKGKLQIMIVILICLTFSLQGIQTILLVYTYYTPQFKCLDKSVTPPFEENCTQTEGCSNPDGYLLFSAKSSIVTENFLWCEESSKKSLALFLIFLIPFVILIFINGLSDKYGRRIYLRTSIIIILMTSGLGIFLNNFYAFIFINVILFTGVYMFITNCSIYLAEICSDDLLIYVNVIMYLISGLSAITANYFALNIKSYHTFYFLLFILSLCISPFIFLLHESLYFAYCNQSSKETKKIAHFMAKFNHKDSEYLKLKGKSITQKIKLMR